MYKSEKSDKNLHGPAKFAKVISHPACRAILNIWPKACAEGIPLGHLEPSGHVGET